MFQALHDGRFRIWRSDPDGSGARMISTGEDNDVHVMVSADGRWIYYTSVGKTTGIMRMAADNSETQVLARLPVSSRGFSPDGRQILAWVHDASLGATHVILDAETGAIHAKVDLPEGAQAGWGRHADVLSYILEDDGVSNLWEQPVAGGAPRQLTRFTSGRIFNFSYSPDRKRLFLARGHRTGDVWLLRDFR